MLITNKCTLYNCQATLHLTYNWVSMLSFCNCVHMNKLFHGQARTVCSAWSDCRTSVQRDGCTFNDLLTQVLQYSRWTQFFSYDDVNQQRYNEAVDSLYHLCSNIEPGTNQEDLQCDAQHAYLPPQLERYLKYVGGVTAKNNFYFTLLTLTFDLLVGHVILTTPPRWVICFLFASNCRDTLIYQI